MVSLVVVVEVSVVVVVVVVSEVFVGNVDVVVVSEVDTVVVVEVVMTHPNITISDNNIIVKASNFFIRIPLLSKGALLL